MKQTLACLLLVAITVGVYWASFPGAFHYDDFPLLLENPRVSAPSFDYGSFAEMYGGRPLTLWSFHLSYRFFGADPGAFHALNVLLHALAGLLLFLLLRQWGLSLGLAFSTALIFLVHPAQAQAVDYVWARSVLLMAAFGLGAMLLVRDHPWWALVALQLAVWSRAEALVFVVPLVLLDRRVLKPALVLGSVDLACFVYGLILASPAQFAWNYSGWLDFWLQGPAVLLQYLGWMIWPNQFSIFHGPSTVHALHLMMAMAVLTALAAATLVGRRHFTTAWVGVGWACLFLLPSVLLPNSEPFSESRSYVALAGLALAAAWIAREAILRLGEALRRPGLIKALGPAMLIALALAGAFMTRGRHRVWADDVALWREAVAFEPDAVLPNYNLAVALSKQGNTKEACSFFARAADLNPRDDMSYAGLGYCAEVNGRIDQAAEYYSHALTLNRGSDYAREALSRLGVSPGPEGAKP